MKKPFFAVEPVDESFFETAPQRLIGTFDISRSASEVWGELVTDHPLSWCRVLGNGIEWTSDRPFGLGTTRTAKVLKGLGEAHEYYFRWEEGRRHSFYVLESSMPIYKRLAEDYLVEPTGENSCRFTWTIAWEPTLIGKGPASRWILGTVMSDTRKHFNA
jgi:hypothetical protein